MEPTEVYIWADATAKDWYTMGVKLNNGSYAGWFSNLGDAFVDCGLVGKLADLPVQGGYVLCVHITSRVKR